MLRKSRAELDRFRAEAEKFRAEAAVQRNLIETSGVQVDIERWRRERAQVEHDVWKLQALFVREYSLVGYITQGTREYPDTISPCMENLSTWSRFKPGCPIKIILDTPGGDIFAGMALFDFLQGLRRKGHEITIHGQGVVASMGSVLMQAASVRTMGRECLMLVHEGGGSSHGTMGELQDSLGLFTKLTERIATIFIERAHGKISRSDFLVRWTRKDWWMSAPEALENGFIDEVLE